jgi:hypothetical protein
MLRLILPILVILNLTIDMRSPLPSHAAEANDKESVEKAQALLMAATEALGGKKYLRVKSERSRGYLTPYRENNPEKLALQSFIDYIVLPDRERVEFKGQGRRFVQSNTGTQGWVYDSDSQLLRDQTEVQRQRFVRGLRYQLDQILRGGWSATGVRLSYLPKQEIWTRQSAEGVLVAYPDGEEVSLFFEPQTSLPLALRFPRETDKGNRVNAENRFFKFIEINGIKSPYVVDLFEGDNQILRLNYEEREYNIAIPEKLFVKPESAKELK